MAGDKPADPPPPAGSAAAAPAGEHAPPVDLGNHPEPAAPTTPSKK